MLHAKIVSDLVRHDERHLCWVRFGILLGPAGEIRTGYTNVTHTYCVADEIDPPVRESENAAILQVG
jgi:hypothetical protein